MAAWELWEKALLPSLLSGAGTWFGMKSNSKAINMCDDLQNYFWRVILTVPESCPKIALRCETGSLGMKWRVWTAKILLVMRIKQQDTSSLCRQIYEEGRTRGWPGLGEEVSEICREIGIPDANEVLVSKSEVKKAIHQHHYTDLKKELSQSKKLDNIRNEDFSEVQTYFNCKSVENGRMSFKVRSQMVPDIPGNFKNKFKRKVGGEDGLICSYCAEQQVMTQGHCLECPAWVDIRKGLDLTNIADLVIFFRKMLAERSSMEAESVKGQHRTTPVQ